MTSRHPYRSEQAPNLVVVLPAQAKAIAAIDSKDGKERWRTALPFVPCSYAFATEAIVVAGPGGEVCGVSIDGELLWHNKLEGLGLGVPLLVPAKLGARGNR
jgi:hypothetical protein